MVLVLRRAVCALVVLAVTTLAGCADDAAYRPDSGSVLQPTPSTGIPDSSASELPGPSSTPTPARNDLEKAPAEHVIKASGLTVKAKYSPRLPVAEWTAAANKPLALSLSSSSGKSGQKIYLTRVTVTITARDDAGPLDSPRSLVDTANISPGFLVTSPYTYGQDFVIPALDEGATSVTLDFTYEFLLQVGKDSRDYYKQTAIDSLVVPIGP